MKTLYAEGRRRELEERLRRLTAGSTPRWGRFDAPKMVVHCADALRMALGKLPTESKRLPIRHPPLKQLFVYWLPWPKGAPTARELLERAPAEWDAEIAGLLARREVLDDLENPRVQAQVFGSAPARDHEGVVFGLAHRVEIEVQREVVPGFLGVGLVAFEVVNGGAAFLSRTFARTDRVNRVTDHQERLKGNHDLVVFDEISHQHQDLLARHRNLLGSHDLIGDSHDARRGSRSWSGTSQPDTGTRNSLTKFPAPVPLQNSNRISPASVRGGMTCVPPKVDSTL